MDHLTVLNEWLSKNNEIKEIGKAFKQLMENLGFNKFIWLKKNNEGLSTFFSSNFSNQDHEFDKDILDEILDREEVIHNNGKEFYLLNSNEKLNEGDFILADIKAGDAIIQSISFALFVLNKNQEISFLESSLIVQNSNIGITPSFVKELDYSLPESFISSVIPVVVHTVVNEIQGPSLVSADPRSFDQPENMLFVVNIYASISADQVARLGHVSTSIPSSNPVDGEINSIVFSIPNETARGHVEIHSVSVVLSQRFINISKLLIFQIKSILFTGVEKIRSLIITNKWDLVQNSDEIASDQITDKIHMVLFSIRIQLANIFAMQIGKEEVLKSD